MSFQGQKNAYFCPQCGKVTVTVDRDEGVTPFMLGCRAAPGCKGMARSSLYRCDQSLTATHEWYRPDAAEIALSKPAAREHFRMGGLTIRPITPEPAP